jgi:hypothetical protein
MQIKFFIPQWTDEILAQIAPILAEITAYVEKARRGQGLSDCEIGTDIDYGWPELVPGGAVVRAGADGTIWVMSAAFIRGESTPS